MKAGIFALITVIAVVGLVTINSICLYRVIGDITENALALDISSESALDDACGLKQKFERAERFISLTVNHEDLTNIEECYSELIGYLSVGMQDEAEVTKSRLIDALTHLKRLSGVNIDSII